MLHWFCMCGRIATIFVLFLMTDNLCFTGVVCLVGLQLLFHCYLWLIIYFSLVLYCLVGWRLFLYCCLLLIIYAWLVLHVCSDCDYFSTIPMIDNLFFTGLVLSGRMTTILVLLNIIDNLWLTGVVYLVGLRQFWYCSLWMIIYASVVLYVWSNSDYLCTVSYDW